MAINFGLWLLYLLVYYQNWEEEYQEITKCQAHYFLFPVCYNSLFLMTRSIASVNMVLPPCLLGLLIFRVRSTQAEITAFILLVNISHFRN
jgi:hypothetical protein